MAPQREQSELLIESMSVNRLLLDEITQDLAKLLPNVRKTHSSRCFGMKWR